MSTTVEPDEKAAYYEAEGRLREALRNRRGTVVYSDLDPRTPGGPAWEQCTLRGSEIALLLREAADDHLGPIDITGAWIAGPLPLDLAELTVPLALRSCRLAGGVDLDNARLGGITLEGCLVGRLATGRALTGRFATIAGELELTGTTFEGVVNLGGLTTAGGVGFDGCTVTRAEGIDGLAAKDLWALDLTNAEVRDLTFVGATVKGGISLAGATVSGQLNIRECTMTGGAGARALFAQRAKITESLLANDISHQSPHTSFRGSVDLRGIDVGGHLDLRNAVAISSSDTDGASGGAPSLLLAHAKIADELRLAGLGLPDGGTIDLRRCTAGHLLRPAVGDGITLHIEGLSYRTVDGTGEDARAWISHAEAVPPGAFTTLATAAATSGEPKDERRAKIAAAHAAASTTEQVLWRWIGYGFRPYLVALPLIFFALVCGLQVAAADDDTPSSFAPVMVDEEPVVPADCDDSTVRCLDPVLYAIDSVVPIDLGQVSAWRPDTDTSGGRWLARTSAFNQIAAWAITGVFIAALAGRLNRT